MTCPIGIYPESSAFDTLSTKLPIQFSPLPTTREERGRQIAQQGGIYAIGTHFAVPTQSPRATAAAYLVDLVDQTCTCPDFELTKSRCKHQEAVLFWIAWEGKGRNANEDAQPAKRRTYPQNWSAYNEAQTTEKAHIEVLLKSLCDALHEPPQSGRGRRRITLRDGIFASVMKVYSTLSGRRATTDIRDSAQRLEMVKVPHYNSIFRCLESEATTQILTGMIEECAAPLAQIENLLGQFSQDSTGFSMATYARWFDQKYGKLRAKHAWVKLHIMVGTATNVVAGVKVSGEADCPLLPGLLKTTAQRFRVREVSADKAYLSKANLKAIEEVGAEPFIPFKANSTGGSSTSPQWGRMWAHFSLRGEDFLKHYHRRSNVESTMWMLKSKFGSSVRSKLPTAQVNEVLCKVLCHNLTCIVHAITEFGIKADFTTRSSIQPLAAVKVLS